jgi:hypothetical protein
MNEETHRAARREQSEQTHRLLKAAGALLAQTPLCFGTLLVALSVDGQVGCLLGAESAPLADPIALRLVLEAVECLTATRLGLLTAKPIDQAMPVEAFEQTCAELVRLYRAIAPHHGSPLLPFYFEAARLGCPGPDDQHAPAPDAPCWCRSCIDDAGELS